ncbi:hypothetical protein M2145_002299 [Lachnospiraceae bacterium PF1-21]|uniref:Dabb family protein n=1 Tax=Ohessyouella blattaphilus TaxID=2949333 RepID=A0ABT1EJ45_9FIRM|nr:Dabb family protein [Ohessyouella blattaphilus]MCP1110730.1 Dabb family protein [Ohessyouella blattaphilus]MCR8564124.1 Dabb family protein [Ohessyouella blattaphilus]MDL2250766.1 Dabb family protein [Lachnospiraceae bacterium OttesenSCG-928-J05]
MVKHVVMWNFKPEIAEEEKDALKKAMKESLEGLVGKVPGLVDAKYIEMPLASSTHQIGLVSTHEKAEDIAVYAKHPDHVLAADTYVRPFVFERACLDYVE